ncbi:MAG TPA: 3-phosphoserine/phosphohydroxythreonine transaminase [Burkholderiales bacterium]|jgi:phosphoserine aminotransferase
MAPSLPGDAPWNFSAGPAVLPRAVLARIREELPDYASSGQSVLELPFSGGHYRDIAARAEQALRALLSIPTDYAVLFLQGGASAQFALLPLNLLGEHEVADYVETGYWSAKCIGEARRYCRVNVAASSADTDFDRVPEPAAWRASPQAAYLHITSNETANGVEYPWTPVRLRTPLVADMSSSFLTRPVDFSDYGAIYASAQKNIGPAGLTVVIVHRALFERERPLTPAVFSYRRQAEADSKLSTPPTFAVYVAGLVFDWIAAQGGLTAMEAASRRKSEVVYRAIDGSEGFYRCPVLPAFRSRVNVCFRLREQALTQAFVAQAQDAGLFNLQGHSKVGGLRASLYNAMPMAGADALAIFMHDFARRHG